MPSWNSATWGHGENKPMPPKEFYVASIPLGLLRNLGGVQPRTKEARRSSSAEAGYQRSHEGERLVKISRYVEYGYPLSSAPSLKPDQHRELINPGWLPTAILVNVLREGETRPRGAKDWQVAAEHLVRIEKKDGNIQIDLPELSAIDSEKFLPPLEIIDGQHRLLSVDELGEFPNDYEVPVVLFDNLPPVWQAYLFWVINVEPKKINTSLAFDLYPELRNQEWLDKGESIKIYQEHRAQELAEVLWRHTESPWHERIELFGKRVEGHISNAAAIRSLSATFVRPWRKKDEEDEFRRLGGLFGSIDRGSSVSYVIGWKRPQQAAFLIECWRAVEEAIKKADVPWVAALRNEGHKGERDPAFYGGGSLLATDQGFRSACFAFNSLCQVVFQELELIDWHTHTQSEPSVEAVDTCLRELRSKQQILNFLKAVASQMVTGMDWRTSSAPGLDERQKADQAQYRGSSGYSALNKAAIKAIAESSTPLVKGAAKKVSNILGWSDV